MTPLLLIRLLFCLSANAAWRQLVRRSHVKRWLLLALTVGAFAERPMAQPPTDTVWREITIGDDLVVTAQYAPTHSSQSVHAVQVVRAAQWQQQGMTTLTEVLRQQLNMQVTTDAILGNGIQIQGIGGQNVQLMVDGVPIIGRTNGNVDLSQLNLAGIERIEIVRGALSAQYGSNAAGGVINLITKPSQVKRWTVSGQHQVESIGMQQQQLSVGFQPKNWYVGVQGFYQTSQMLPLDSLRLTTTVTTDDGSRFTVRRHPWLPKVQHGMRGTVRYRPQDSLDVSYQFAAFAERLLMPGIVRRPQFRPYALDETFETVRNDHRLRWRQHWRNGTHLEAITAYNAYARTQWTERLDLEADTATILLIEGDTSLFWAVMQRVTWSGNWGERWAWQLGGEYQLEQGKGERLVDTSAAGGRLSRHNAALWGSATFTLPDAGLRLQANLRGGYNSAYRHPLIPSVHASWTPNAAWEVRASVARGFRAPTLTEQYFRFIDVNHFIIGNEDLRAEHSWNATAAAKRKWSIEAGELAVQATAFYNQIQDQITLAQYEPLRFRYENIDALRTHGGQVQADWSHKRWGTLTSGLALTRIASLVTDGVAQSLPTRHQWQWPTQWTGQLPGWNTRLTVHHRWHSDQVNYAIDSDGNVGQQTIAGYHWWDVSVQQALWANRLQVTAGIRNIGDVQRLAVEGVANGGGAHSGGAAGSQLLSQGRTYFVQLNWKLSR